MFGLGKKKKQEQDELGQENPKTTSQEENKSVNEADIKINDEDLVVMPEQFRPASSRKAGGAGKSKLLVLVIIIIILGLLSIALYFFVFSNKQAPGQQTGDTGSSSSQSPTDQNPPEPQTPVVAAEPKIISSSAFDDSNQAIGSIRITIPGSIADEYGDKIGAVVLNKNDLSLPPGVAVLGGVYSLYPVGQQFPEKLSAAINYSNMPAGVTAEDLFPAHLSGTVWQEISEFISSETSTSISFDLDKLPNGPVAIIYKTAGEDESNIAGSDEVIPSQDSDQDGLTDKEEELIGTDLMLPDTDGDSYNDKIEIFGGYSPLQAGEKLAVGQFFTLYTNPTYGYSGQYPASWLADSLDQTNKQILFISDTAEFFEILVVENSTNTPIVDWYRSLSPSLAAADVDIIIVDGQAAVKSVDGLTMYVGKNGLVYILTYNSGTLEQVSWPTMYEYFLHTFKFGSGSNGSGNGNGEVGQPDGNL